MNVCTSQRKELLSFNTIGWQCGLLHTLLIVSVDPQPIDVSSFYQRDLHETMQPRRRRGWNGPQGGLKGGNEEKDGGHNVEKTVKEESVETSSSSDAETSSSEESQHSDEENNREGFHTDDERLDYGSEDSELSSLLDEELERVQADEVEEMELSLPAEGWTDCKDEMHAGGSNHEPLPIPLPSSACWELSPEGIEDITATDQVEGGDEDNAEVEVKVDGNDEEGVSGAKFLNQLDKDYICSPRLIVRGVYVGDVLKLVVKRKTEGTYVDWTMFNTNQNTQVLNIKGEMTYPFALSREAQSTRNGVKVRGGWCWTGFGYGYINLFPSKERPDPTKILHVDIHEAIFFGEDIPHHYHVSGQECMKVRGAADVKCRQEGCGLRIWSVMFTTFETADEKVEWYQPRRKRKEREVGDIYLSMVAFFNGEYKIVLHREARLKRYEEEVAWLTKDEKAFYSDSVAAVDRVKLDKARLISETRVPKSRTEEATLAQVSKLYLSFDSDGMKSNCRS